jgi:hypothetical protein
MSGPWSIGGDRRYPSEREGELPRQEIDYHPLDADLHHDAKIIIYGVDCDEIGRRIVSVLNADREVPAFGREVRILRCEARAHGEHPGCVCHLIGGVERIARRHDTVFAGTQLYHLVGRPQRVRLSEVEFIAGKGKP